MLCSWCWVHVWELVIWGARGSQMLELLSWCGVLAKPVFCDHLFLCSISFFISIPERLRPFLYWTDSSLAGLFFFCGPWRSQSLCSVVILVRLVRRRKMLTLFWCANLFRCKSFHPHIYIVCCQLVTASMQVKGISTLIAHQGYWALFLALNWCVTLGNLCYLSLSLGTALGRGHLCAWERLVGGDRCYMW